jgi:uncharacterized BrkB/YihY/UPF0761 family membrane protein
MEEILTLKGLLSWLVAAGGAGIFTSWLLDKWVWYQKWDDDFWKMVVAIILPGPIALLAYMGMIAMLYVRPPTDARQWIETIYAVMAAAIVGQLAHKFKQR